MSRRMILGRQPDGTIGLRISLPGFDAGASPPVPKNLAFDANWPSLLPIHQTGAVTFGTGTTNNLATWPTLAYLPMSALFVKANGRNTAYDWGYPDKICDGSAIMNSGYYGNGSFMQIYVSKSSINTVYQKVAGDNQNPGTFTLHYVIFKVGT